jgi:cytochrome c oxidase subunit 4
MSSTIDHTTDHAALEHEQALEHAHEFSEHMSDWQYVKVALLLGVLTAIEVLTYFIDFGELAVPTLLVLMVLKFAIVVAYFMHLRFDNSLFTKVFLAGLITAVIVYIAVFLTFAFWTDWL